MGIIEEISQLRKEGVEDNEISNRLIDEGISPQKIRDAFDQIKIKKAVSSENLMENTMQIDSTPQNSELNYEQSMQQMENYPPQQEEYYSPPENTLPSQENNNIQNNEYYSPQEYQEGYAPQESGFDTSTIIEIAEQVFSEKTAKIEKQLDKFGEFISLAELRIVNNDERIKRIEKIIDNLQIKILEKIGSYGENIDGIKKEMSMMQDSFSKTLPALVEKNKTKKK
jgi:hypothetical protein